MQYSARDNEKGITLHSGVASGTAMHSETGVQVLEVHTPKSLQ